MMVVVRTAVVTDDGGASTSCMAVFFGRMSMPQVRCVACMVLEVPSSSDTSGTMHVTHLSLVVLEVCDMHGAGGAGSVLWYDKGHKETTRIIVA